VVGDGGGRSRAGETRCDAVDGSAGRASPVAVDRWIRGRTEAWLVVAGGETQQRFVVANGVGEGEGEGKLAARVPSIWEIFRSALGSLTGPCNVDS
jgi:hypothetical protein